MLWEILFTLEGATDWNPWLRMEGMLKQGPRTVSGLR
jgi:hypothetical protein